MLRKQRLDPRLIPLRRPLVLTWLGLLAEQIFRAFWPFASLMALALGLLMLGLHEALSLEMVWGFAALWGLALLLALAYGGWRFGLPSQEEVIARLDSGLPGHPLRALLDSQAMGTEDAASAGLWQAHQHRMAARAKVARAPLPDLRLAAKDPFALRYLALVTLLLGLLFGSFWRATSLTEMTPGAKAGLSGPSWEGWIMPPRYTGLPVLYLNDQEAGTLVLPQGSEITLRFYGELGALELVQDVSAPSPEGADPAQTGAEEAAALTEEFSVERDGQVAIAGPGGRSWQVAVLPDQPPAVSILGLPELTQDGALSLGFAAEDDYGITGGEVRISLDHHGLDRRHGLAADPTPREEILLDLPLPLNGNRQEFQEFLIEDFAQHPWANLPVIYSFTVRDAAGQSAVTAGLGAPLVAPRFFDPLAAALAEQRRDLLWTHENGSRIAQVMRALSHRPQEIFREAGHYLQMRAILRRIESALGVASSVQERGKDPASEVVAEVSEALWELAHALEHGDIGNALERMQRAKDRLSQAMRDGASPEEIARLMQELRAATQEYLQQLQRQAQRQQQQSGEGAEGQDSAMTLSQQDLQEMMDHIQDLMEQGRMAEAQQALEEFQRMMENMRMTEGQSGQSGSEGQQALEELGETLRQQQGLSDQAFRDLQEQFNPDAQAGQNQGNEGRDGGQGRGQQHQGGGTQPGEGGSGGSGQEGQAGRDQGQGLGQQAGRQPEAGAEEGGAGAQGSLAQRQRALREELQRQQQGLPLEGGSEGQASREALDRAGRAMDQAEEALRGNDLAGAIDHQSDAMEALREGMRALGEALAQSQQEDGQQQGTGQGRMSTNGTTDPLGRANGAGGSEENGRIGQTQRARRRAWDLVEELRRRAGEKERSQEELNYFERLLDQF